MFAVTSVSAAAGAADSAVDSLSTTLLSGLPDTTAAVAAVATIAANITDSKEPLNETTVMLTAEKAGGEKCRVISSPPPQPTKQKQDLDNQHQYKRHRLLKHEAPHQHTIAASAATTTRGSAASVGQRPMTSRTVQRALGRRGLGASQRPKDGRLVMGRDGVSATTLRNTKDTKPRAKSKVANSSKVPTAMTAAATTAWTARGGMAAAGIITKRKRKTTMSGVSDGIFNVVIRPGGLVDPDQIITSQDLNRGISPPKPYLLTSSSSSSSSTNRAGAAAAAASRRRRGGGREHRGREQKRVMSRSVSSMHSAHSSSSAAASSPAKFSSSYSSPAKVDDNLTNPDFSFSSPPSSVSQQQAAATVVDTGPSPRQSLVVLMPVAPLTASDAHATSTTTTATTTATTATIGFHGTKSTILSGGIENGASAGAVSAVPRRHNNGKKSRDIGSGFKLRTSPLRLPPV